MCSLSGPVGVYVLLGMRASMFCLEDDDSAKGQQKKAA